MGGVLWACACACVFKDHILLPRQTAHLPPRTCHSILIPTFLLSFQSFTTFSFSFPLNILSSSILPSLLSAASYPSFPSKFLFSFPSPLLPTDFPLIIPSTHLLGSWKDFLAGSRSWAGYNNQEGVFHLSLPPGSPLFPAHPPPGCLWRPTLFQSVRLSSVLSLGSNFPKAKQACRLQQLCHGLLNEVLALAVKSESTKAGMGGAAETTT